MSPGASDPDPPAEGASGAVADDVEPLGGAEEVRALRADIRHWRRGRAEARLVDVLEDVYIGVFAALMLGAMLTNVVLNVARISDELCTSEACRSGRSALPWLVALGTLATIVAMARLFGPVFVSPAVASWLLPGPADRGALLRPCLLLASVLAGTAAIPAVLIGAALAGFGPAPIVAVTVTIALLALALTAALAAAQAGTAATPTSGAGTGRGVRRPVRPGAVLAWLLGGGVWAGLSLIAVGAAPALSAPTGLGPGWWAAVAVAALAAVLGVLAAMRRLALLRSRDVAPGGTLTPGISGALATLDLALVYDVVLTHRWRQRSHVRPRRRGPAGPAALLHADLVRVRRSPQWVVVLLMSLAAPYAVTATGAGRIVVLVAGLAGFLAALPLLVGLRVLTRTPSLLRMLPFPLAQARRLTLAVPAVLLVAFGALTAPVARQAVGGSPGDAVVIGVATGLVALAAAARWVTGRPPDYTRPLVSTPAGGVPTNLYGSVLRGFDVLLLGTAPMLLSPTGDGAMFSGLVALVVLGYLTSRR